MIRKPKTTLEYLLLALVPYSRPNINLAINLPRFFYELEQVTKVNKKTIRSTFYRAQKSGYLTKVGDTVKLTDAGMDRILPYTAKELKGNVVLMVMFDIPEQYRDKRDSLRRFLQKLDFKQVQLSVWSTKMDYRQELKEYVAKLELEDYVEVFESVKL